MAVTRETTYNGLTCIPQKDTSMSLGTCDRDFIWKESSQI